MTKKNEKKNENNVKPIPYGVTNYERVVQKKCYYVDETMYLKAIEKAGDYLFFIRPRRFGKSLFLAVMEAYRETDIFDLNLSKYADLMTDMAYDGKWEPLFDLITGRMRKKS